MKLFRKIFFQAILGFLLISQFTMAYFLYASQNQTLKDQRKSQEIIFIDKFREFNRKVEESSKIAMEKDGSWQRSRRFGKFSGITELFISMGNGSTMRHPMNLIIQG